MLTDHQVWSSTTAAEWRGDEILPALALSTLFAQLSRYLFHQPCPLVPLYLYLYFAHWKCICPCSLNTLCTALQVHTTFTFMSKSRPTHFALELEIMLSQHSWTYPYKSRIKVVQDYSGWASYMGAGAVLCCLASALAGIITINVS